MEVNDDDYVILYDILTRRSCSYSLVAGIMAMSIRKSYLTENIKNTICIMLAFMIIAFVCDTDRVEQGRFVENAQKVICDDNVSLSVASTPRTNTDAVEAGRSAHSEALEFRLTGRQSKKAVRSHDILIFLVLLVSLIYLLNFRHSVSFVCIQSDETSVIDYILRQDGKK